MAAGGRNKDARVARERARAYQARQELHAAQVHRRRRDNLVAGLGGGIVLVAILAGQFAFFNAGPGKHPTSSSPAPSATPTASVAPPSATPSATTASPSPTSSR
ncbi:MAG TPA: dioxygenase [Microbacterium sp.]|uniref:dioxygenase n=1 Tax=Microbacterium sp. TaxID=51671 RepID=UPI002B46C862|nr:dioxygenase [Microbacterium sp.]HKT55740.1 dioxygenase [Microbacterium sp.]